MKKINETGLDEALKACYHGRQNFKRGSMEESFFLERTELIFFIVAIFITIPMLLLWRGLYRQMRREKDSVDLSKH